MYHELSHQEIAAILGTTVGRSRRIVPRARQPEEAAGRRSEVTDDAPVTRTTWSTWSRARVDAERRARTSRRAPRAATQRGDACARRSALARPTRARAVAAVLGSPVGARRRRDRARTRRRDAGRRGRWPGCGVRWRWRPSSWSPRACRSARRDRVGGCRCAACAAGCGSAATSRWPRRRPRRRDHGCWRASLSPDDADAGGNDAGLDDGAGQSADRALERLSDAERAAL